MWCDPGLLLLRAPPSGAQRDLEAVPAPSGAKTLTMAPSCILQGPDLGDGPHHHSRSGPGSEVFWLRGTNRKGPQQGYTQMGPGDRTQVQEVSAGVPRPRGAGREHQDKGTSAAGGLLPSFQFLFLARLGGSGPARTPGGSLRSPRYPASPGTPASPACAASVQPARPGPAPRHVRPRRAHSHRDAMNCSPAAVRTPPSCRPPSRGYRSGPRGLRFGDCGTRTLEDPP